jgi:hypothetical protein
MEHQVDSHVPADAWVSWHGFVAHAPNVHYPVAPKHAVALRHEEGTVRVREPSDAFQEGGSLMVHPGNLGHLTD